MPRKGYIAKREVLPDPIYHDVVVTKLINNIMRIDNSWSKSAHTYLDMYKSTFTK